MLETTVSPLPLTSTMGSVRWGHPRETEELGLSHHQGSCQAPHHPTPGLGCPLHPSPSVRSPWDLPSVKETPTVTVTHTQSHTKTNAHTNEAFLPAKTLDEPKEGRDQNSTSKMHPKTPADPQNHG